MCLLVCWSAPSFGQETGENTVVTDSSPNTDSSSNTDSSPNTEEGSTTVKVEEPVVSTESPKDTSTQTETVTVSTEPGAVPEIHPTPKIEESEAPKPEEIPVPEKSEEPAVPASEKPEEPVPEKPQDPVPVPEKPQEPVPVPQETERPPVVAVKLDAPTHSDPPVKETPLHLQDRVVSISIDLDALNDATASKNEDDQYFANFDATVLATQWQRMAANYDAASAHQMKGGEVLIQAPAEMIKRQKEREAERENSQEVSADLTDEAKKQMAEKAKSIFQSSSVFSELSVGNVMYYVHQHKPFVLFLLCDCWEDLVYAEALKDVEESMKSKKYHESTVPLYIYPENINRFQLPKVFHTGKDIRTVFGESNEHNQKTAMVSWGKTLSYTPTADKLTFKIVDECCGDKFEVKLGAITNKGFELTVKRTDKDSGWGQFLQIEWALTPAVHHSPTMIIDNIPNGSNNEKFVFRMADFPLSVQQSKTRAQLLDEFITGFMNKAEYPALLVRSQPSPVSPPLDLSPGKILDVVGVNFEQVVLDKTKDVFVLIYSPYCGASIAVMPLFEQVAKEMEKDTNVRVVRFDKTANDLPIRDVIVTHYPTAYMFPACQHGASGCQLLDFADFNGSKTPHNKDVPHSHFTKEGMANFIKEHGYSYQGMVHKSYS